MNKFLSFCFVILLILIIAAVTYFTSIKSKHKIFDNGIDGTYTCPMPQDSFFSDQPGECPKCGMTLIETKGHNNFAYLELMNKYTCPMPEDSVFSDTPGICPKCGMTLVKAVIDGTYGNNKSLANLLEPTNSNVVGEYSVAAVLDTSIGGEIYLPGKVEYDPNFAVNIATRVNGRIEKMYINYKFQTIKKGQKLFDLYSPELLTEQQNYIFLLTKDPNNTSLISASQQKLLLYGITEDQINQLIKFKTANPIVTIYSPVSGIVVGSENFGNSSGNIMLEKSANSKALTVKEGNYVQKGEIIFRLMNTDKVWGIFNVVQRNSSFVKVNQLIYVTSEIEDMKPFTAKINHIETRFASVDKTYRVRVYLNNNNLMMLPIGLRLEGRVMISPIKGLWINKKSVVNTGDQHIVFVKHGNGFKAKAIEAGFEMGEFVQILGGISIQDVIVQNAQFLMDSESFIKIK